MLRNGFLGIAAVSLALAACGGSQASDKTGADGANAVKDAQGNVVSSKAAASYSEAMRELERHDKAGDWTAESCEATAKLFVDAGEEQGSDKYFAAAFYNAGVAYHRCRNFDEARKHYKSVLDKEAKFHRARVQLARFDFEASGGKDVDRALAEFTRAVADSEFQNVEALVEVARLQMKRNNAVSDADGASDVDRAKKNLQRALAVDDGFMPAYNQLAIYYLQRAKQTAGASGAKVSRGAQAPKLDMQALDLAVLVSQQATRKNPSYAAIHNTAGLIFAESGDLNRAVQSFGQARRLDATFFEAHMNYAAVNMQFRGFNEAAEAYAKAISLRSNDYDAHLGLALALRGQVDTAPDGDAKLSEAEKYIEKAKSIDPARPEAYFNHAILTQEYKAKAAGDAATQALERAIALYKEFVSKAQGKAEFADAVEDVNARPTKKDSECFGAKAKGDKACKRGRIFDIEDIIAFNKQSAADQKKLEEEKKNQAALEEAGAAAEASSAK